MSPPIEFLMAEYQFLKELRDNQISQGQNRFNFYLILISSAVALVALITDDLDPVDEPRIFLTGGLVALILSYLGWLTLKRIVETHIQATRHTRALNLIRRYFVEQHPEVEAHIYYPADEKQPAFGVLGTTSIEDTGLTNMTILLNVAVGTIGVSSLLWFLLDQPGQADNDALHVGLLLGMALITVVMIYQMQRRHVRSAIQTAKDAYDKQD